MTGRAKEIVQALDLQPHPEGGFFRETYRSDIILNKETLPGDFPGNRNCSTGIYFLLAGENKSRFHRIRSDEMWHHYEGCCVIIHMINSSGKYSKIKLGKGFSKGEVQQAVVPAGVWFGAELEDKTGYCLSGCTVSPGFDFIDFELARMNEMLVLYPEQSEIIKKLT